MQRGILGVLVLLALPGFGWGQLAFESKLVKEEVSPAVDTFQVEFPFKNEKLSQVTIVEIDSSCGCLSATSDKTVFEAGDTGVVRGKFKVGARTGTFEKALVVKTNSEEGELTQELRVRVTIPEVMQLKPKLLSWTVGEAPEPKNFILEVLQDAPVNVKEVSTSREGFSCTVHELEKGKKYRLELTPTVTGEPMMGMVRVETDCAIAKHSRQLGFFSVKKEG